MKIHIFHHTVSFCLSPNYDVVTTENIVRIIYNWKCNPILPVVYHVMHRVPSSLHTHTDTHTHPDSSLSSASPSLCVCNSRQAVAMGTRVIFCVRHLRVTKSWVTDFVEKCRNFTELDGDSCSSIINAHDDNRDRVAGDDSHPHHALNRKRAKKLHI